MMMRLRSWTRYAGLAIGLAMALSPRVVAEDVAPNQARFGRFQGTVDMLTPGSPEWKPVHLDLPIENGDQIRVGEDGEVELIMARQAMWIAGPNTELVVEHTENAEGVLTLSRGNLIGKVTPSEDAQHWEFQTPTAVCAVRGTEFALNVTQAAGSTLGVFEGEVEMKSMDPNESAATIHANEEGLLKPSKPFHKRLSLSPAMVERASRIKTHLSKRQAEVQREWSPFTPAYRQELRRKFVAPVPKPAHPRRRVPQRQAKTS